MTIATVNSTPVHNLGLIDRMVRFFGGGMLLAYGIVDIVLNGNHLAAAAAIILAVYPLMTTVMGWDPFYQIIGGRSCSLEGGRNQCGTLPFEVDAAMGHNPKPPIGREHDHSLTAARHSK